MRKLLMVAALVVSGGVLPACGDDSGDSTEETPNATGGGTLDPADFSATVDNPLFPLRSTDTFVYEGEEDGAVIRVESTVQAERDTIAGFEVTVVKVREYEDGELVEETLDYYAQHTDGTVYYFGEDVDDYENGELVGHHGAWTHGENGAEAGEFMPADPQVGQEFEQEKAPGVAEDRSKIVALDLTVETAAGSFEGCVRTEDYAPLDDVTEFKLYCPDVGLVREEFESGSLDLVSY